LRIRRFCTATKAGVRHTAFLASLLLLRRREVGNCLAFLRRTSDLRTSVGNGLDIAAKKDLGLDGMTPLVTTRTTNPAPC
jgi:hypothetical protein